MSKRSQEELAYYRDPYKAPEQLVEARAWVEQAEDES